MRYARKIVSVFLEMRQRFLDAPFISNETHRSSCTCRHDKTPTDATV